jgi:hypothetical protein
LTSTFCGFPFFSGVAAKENRGHQASRREPEILLATDSRYVRSKDLKRETVLRGVVLILWNGRYA